MIYMLLSTPYKDFDKAKVLSFNFPSNGKLVFNYQVYKTSDVTLFDKQIIIEDSKEVLSIKTTAYTNLSPYDAICRSLLEYLKKEGTEKGTIEVA